MKLSKQLCLSLGFAVFLGACTTTGLVDNQTNNSSETSAATDSDEEPDLNLTDEELNALVQPEVTRGSSSTSYSYTPMQCAGASNHRCTNVELVTDESGSSNTSNYYIFQNKQGNCLSSKSDKLDVVDCDLTSDYQYFRLSFVDTSEGRLIAPFSGWEDDYFNRYEFAIIPKKNYEGKTQTYGSSSNPETYWLKRTSSESAVSQGGDCDTGETKCKFYFFPAGVTGSNGTYTLTDSDGTTNNGSWFFLSNKNFYHKSNNNEYCIRQSDERFKIDDKQKYECDRNNSKNLWRVFQYSS